MSRLCHAILLTVFTVAVVADLRGQDPPPPQADPPEEPAKPERVVESRPALYSFKRYANPLTWVELGVKPIWSLAQQDWVYRVAVPDSGGNKKVSGFHFGIEGIGTGSGYGPRITPFHKNLLGKGIDVEMPLLYTYRGYSVYQFNGSVPIAGPKSVQRLSFDFGAGYSARPRDNFFGIGNNTSVNDETEFKMVTRAVSAGWVARFKNHWLSKLYGVYRSVGITAPPSGISAQSEFSPASVPGLYGGRLGSVVFSINRTTELRENTVFKGGIDEFEAVFTKSIDGDQFQYWKARFFSQHFLPLTRDRRKIVAVRGTLETNQPVSGGLVPFFDMPIAGSIGTLRGFDNFRFRDTNVLALTVEYRYRIWRVLDWGFFLDEAQVAPRLKDLALDEFHTGYGVRLFIWPKPNFPMSVDYSRSSETWRMYFNVNTRF